MKVLRLFHRVKDHVCGMWQDIKLIWTLRSAYERRRYIRDEYDYDDKE